MFFSFPFRAMDEMDYADAVVALDESTLPVGNTLARQRTTTRTVWTQKEMHDAYQAELVSLESIPMGSLTEHKRALLSDYSLQRWLELRTS
jgi:hypothetical protein